MSARVLCPFFMMRAVVGVGVVAAAGAAAATAVAVESFEFSVYFVY